MKKSSILLFLFVVIFGFNSCTLFPSTNPSKPSTDAVSADANKQPSESQPTEKKNAKFSLKVGSSVIYLDGNPIQLDVPVQEIDGRTMVPLTFFKDYCGMEDIHYDPSTESIAFTMPVYEKAFPISQPGFSLTAPGNPNEWYQVKFEDTFSGLTQISVMVNDMKTGDEANQIISKQNALAVIPDTDAEKQYTVFTFNLRVDSLEKTENFPMSSEFVSFLTPDGTVISSDHIQWLTPNGIDSVLTPEQTIQTQIAILASSTEIPILVFNSEAQNPLYIQIKN